MPQLGKVLAKHHGFTVTVLFAINKKDGTIDPSTKDNIPGLEALAKADLMVMFLRFRNLPDEQMKFIADYVQAGKPIVGIRTSTHAFALSDKSKYKDWTWEPNKGGGFGKKVFGETWFNHHGGHGSQATRGIIAKDAKDHPIVKGIKDGDVFGPTDVYGVHLPLPGDSKPIVLGQVVKGLKFDDPPLEGKKNDPMMPIAWTKTYEPTKYKKARVFCSTMGSSEDVANEGYRRMMVNACYWAVGLEEKIPDKSRVDLVGEYKPTSFKKPFVKGVKPEEHAMK
jgi:type 1 glutamine amidotransferase